MYMKGIKSYIITGILFVSIVGTLFHFAYEWSKNNILVNKKGGLTSTHVGLKLNNTKVFFFV